MLLQWNYKSIPSRDKQIILVFVRLKFTGKAEWNRMNFFLILNTSMVPLLSYSFCIDFFRSGIEYFLLMVQKVYRTHSRMKKNEIAQYFLLYLYYIFEHIFLFSLFKLFYIDDENIELGSFRNKKVLLIVSNTIFFCCFWLSLEEKRNYISFKFCKCWVYFKTWVYANHICSNLRKNFIYFFKMFT